MPRACGQRQGLGLAFHARIHVAMIARTIRQNDEWYLIYEETAQAFLQSIRWQALGQASATLM
jgi:hypothetical protein